MKIVYLLACVGLFGCTQAFVAGTGGSSTGGSTTQSGTITRHPIIPDAGAVDSGNDAPDCLSCPASNGCGTLDDGCGNMMDCGACPDQVQGYPSACLGNTCQPFNNTIFSQQCVAVCGNMNVGAWNNCLTECQNQDCTVQQSCTNCNFLYSAEPDCLTCLHTNFPGQSCGG